MGKKIRLRHKESEGLQFGPESEIKFGVRGGFPPGITVVDEDHPLYDRLWELEGANLEVVDESGPAKVYVSPIDPEREFKSRASLLSHIRAAAKKGNALAVAWLDANAKADDDDTAADDD